MSRPFRAGRHGVVHVDIPQYGAGLLASLARQLVELLSDGEAARDGEADPLEEILTIDEPREAPEDPALRRLLPDAHLDDAEAAAEFRRYTERGLRDSKVTDALVVVDAIGASDGEAAGDLELDLDAQQARAWMRCLTDMRLTLAARLEVKAGDEDYWAGLPETDDRLPVYEIYTWLGYLLETLIDAASH